MSSSLWEFWILRGWGGHIIWGRGAVSVGLLSLLFYEFGARIVLKRQDSRLASQAQCKQAKKVTSHNVYK